MKIKKIVDFDFASLYPTRMINFSKLLEKEQKQQLRKLKLEQIQKMSDNLKQM